MIHTEGASKEEGAREEIMGKMSIKWMVGTVVVATVGALALATVAVALVLILFLQWRSRRHKTTAPAA